MTATLSPPDYEYDEPVTESGLNDRDFASLVLGSMDYEAQLLTIRSMLQRQRLADDELSRKIKVLDSEARRLVGLANWRASEEWCEHLHASAFQDAAHSMAAVGMLAPLIESMFKRAFLGIRDFLTQRQDPLAHSVRLHMPQDQRWDCRVARGGGDDFVRGVLELAGDLGLGAFLPNDLKPTLEALRGYRNKMLHDGFEWPDAERRKFAERVAREWPPHWFTSASTGGLPWIFYMSDAFVDHCLTTVDAILDGLGRFVRSR
jgi:hypothetical protein